MSLSLHSIQNGSTHRTPEKSERWCWDSEDIVGFTQYANIFALNSTVGALENMWMERVKRVEGGREAREAVRKHSQHLDIDSTLLPTQ